MSNEKKGSTIYEILMNRFRTKKPLELQYYNPLQAKVGCTVSFSCDPEIDGINFVIEKIGVCNHNHSNYKDVVHVDYYLRGVTINQDKPMRFRLRLLPDDDQTNELKCKIMLLKLFDQMEWDETFYESTLCNESGEFDINYDEQGQALTEPNRYWRIDDVKTPYEAKVVLLADKDQDGTVESQELEYHNIKYWDYHRDTVDFNNNAFREFLIVEMNQKSHFFQFLKGKELNAFQVTVI